MKKVIAYAIREKNTDRIVKVGDKYEIFDYLINDLNFNTAKYEVIFLV